MRWNWQSPQPLLNEAMREYEEMSTKEDLLTVTLQSHRKFTTREWILEIGRIEGLL